MRFSQLKSLLKLSDEALELADRHNIDEFRLRPLLDLAPEAQAEMVQQIVRLDLTGRQIREICEQRQDEETPQGEGTLSPEEKRLLRLLKTVEREKPEVFARALLRNEKNVHLARARLQSMISLARDALQYLPDEE
jgi:hypothetical protein